MSRTKRWITVDPGEDTGLSVWEGSDLIHGDTIKMGDVPLMLHHALIDQDPDKIAEFYKLYPECRDFFDQIHPANYEIERIVCEDWKLYPWVMYTPDGRASHKLDFDQCRTARLIGKIEHLAIWAGIPFHLQGADIKETAVNAGAENLYYKPLHENRHQNDAIQHGVFWLVVEEQKAPRDARI